MVFPPRGEKKLLLHISLWVAFAVIIVWQLWNVIFLAHSPMNAYGTFGDEAVVTQAAVRISNGQVPHRDFYSYTSGTAYYPLAGWMKVFGQDYSSVQWFNLITTLALVAAIVWFGSAFSRSVGILSGLAFTFVMYPLWPFVSYHWQFLFFALTGSQLLLVPGKTKYTFLAGLMLVAAGLTLPNKAIFLGLAQVLVLLKYGQSGHRLRSLCTFLSGPIFICCLFVVLLLATHLWDPVWTQLVTNNIVFYPTLVNKSIFGLNNFNFSMIVFSAILGLPLLRTSWLRNEWRKVYVSAFILHAALAVSMLYAGEWVHFMQIGAFFLVLITSATIDRLISSWRLFRSTKTKHFLTSLFIVVPILVVGYWWFHDLVTTSSNLWNYSPRKYQAAFATPQGRVHINTLWDSMSKDDLTIPTIRMLPTIDSLLRGQLSSKRAFFFPYMPGYYFFYALPNPTSYDILPSAQPPEEDRARLKQELLANADALVFAHSTWPKFNSESELMEWMRQNFPYVTSYMDGKIEVYTKIPLE